MARILIVEDDEATRRALARAVEGWGHEAVEAGTLAEGRRRLVSSDPALLLLDRSLPDGDGLELCRALKRDPKTRTIPVVALTSLSEFEDELGGLRSGADLYLPKPFDLEKLEAYARTMLDRLPYRGERPGLIRCGSLVLDPAARRGTLEGRPLPALAPRSFELLCALAERGGRPVTRRTLVRKLWRDQAQDKQVDVAVSRLKAKLGPELGRIVKAVPGVGYAIEP